jgi:hypothetical protein
MCSGSTPTSPSSTNASSKVQKSPLKGKTVRKVRADFSAKDIEHLLCAVIEVDPFMATCSKVGARWKEVATRVQSEGFCLEREPDTLKNKVLLLLAWVEVSGRLDTISMLMHTCRREIR